MTLRLCSPQRQDAEQLPHSPVWNLKFSGGLERIREKVNDSVNEPPHDRQRLCAIDLNQGRVKGSEEKKDKEKEGKEAYNMEQGGAHNRRCH